MTRIKNQFGLIALLVLIATYAAPTHAAGLLTNNEDFNDAPYNFIGFTSGWVNASGVGYYGSTTDPVPGKEGVGLGYLGQGAIFETAAADRAAVTTPGSELFALSFQAVDDGSNGNGIASIVFYNAIATEIGTSDFVLDAGGNLADTFSFTGLAPATATSVGVRVNAPNTPGNPAQFRIDNFVLTSAVVPESGTGFLLATGALTTFGMIVLRRKTA